MITSEELQITRYQFWQAAWIWTSKPHIVNKYLFGVKVLRSFRCLNEDPVDEIIKKLRSLEEEKLLSVSEECLFERLGSDLSLQLCTENDTKTVTEGRYLFFRRILYKKATLSNPVEICFIDYSNDQALFYNYGTESENTHSVIASFLLRFENDRIKVSFPKRCIRAECEWIQFRLLPKLVKWAKESDSVGTYEEGNRGSLNLIPLDRYKELYSMWKEKYGKKLIENWTESTDPLKFIHEDIGIASYLCLLWADKKVNFVDLGCGNGLLVYILSQEGHQGRGIDIRSRKIWNTYPPSTILETATITSENHCVHPDADWLIGNHSDELTPWIPIFATRSSSTCNFFLLPCCAYELSGQKFQRRNASYSMYSDYIGYVKNISEELGFDVVLDRLRIPSTKRICLVGSRKLLNDDVEMKNRVETVLLKYQSKDFVPREAIERVRNCTKIDRVVSNRICDAISKTLIRRQLSNTQSTDIWSTSYSLSFEDAVNLLDPADLKKLKSECGGLQTLLKNNHSVFRVQGGRIYFRKPEEKNHNVDKWKTKPCWFFYNHPMKCPLIENKCSFSH